MEIISRKEAKEQGLKHYYTGKSCKHGHIEPRLTSNGLCKECKRLQTARWSNYNPNYGVDWYHKNRDESIEKRKEWNKNNPSSVRKSQKEWRERNPEYMPKWRADNADTRAAYYNKYRTTRLNAMCGDMAEIELIYKDSYIRGPNWHVDHVLPLSKGGSHSPENLQVVPARYNLWKNNKTLPAEFAETAIELQRLTDKVA